MADRFYKRSGIFDEDRSGFAFREVFTPSREGPLPPRPKPSRKGGSLYDKAVAQPTTSVWSASDASANGMTLSNGGLTINYNGASWESARITSAKSSGKYYVEFLSSATSASSNIGFGLGETYLNSYLGSGGNSGGGFLQGAVIVSGGFTGGGSIVAYTPVLNDVIALAVDLTTGKLWMAVNNVWEASGNPASGSNQLMTIGAPALGLPLFPAISLNSSGGLTGTWVLQATAASQKYAPPAGFSPWG